MSQKMHWNEIEQKYRNQWVSLNDVECDKNGRVTEAVVIANGPDLKTVTKASKGKISFPHKYHYIGEIKGFLGFAKWDINEAQAG